jgi:hypothetical protein
LCDDLVSLMVLRGLVPGRLRARDERADVGQSHRAGKRGEACGIGYAFIGPKTGWLACRNVGAGRLSEPQKIVDEVVAMLDQTATRLETLRCSERRSERLQQHLHLPASTRSARCR